MTPINQQPVDALGYAYTRGMTAKILSFPANPLSRKTSRGKPVVPRVHVAPSANPDSLAELSHAFRVRQPFLEFKGDEVCIEQEQGQPDDACEYTLTMAGRRHFVRLFQAYGLNLNLMYTYGEFQACYEYVFELASELDRWTSASSFRLQLKKAASLKSDSRMHQVLEALFENDLSRVRELHGGRNVVEHCLQRYGQPIPA